MKIIHMADSHLGFSAYGRIDNRGRNLREEMVYKGFKKAVDEIIQIHPDALVHAGDVFHHVRPRIKPLYVFKHELERLVDAGIPVVIISGNHDAPKSVNTFSPFALYEKKDNLDNVYIAHRYRYESYVMGDYTFHCIPFCRDQEDYLQEFKKIKNTGNDVLVMHGMVEALWNKRLRTVGEHELKDSFLKRDFSYIALGHYHGQTQLAQNAWYSGSVEYFRFNEAQDEKGMLLVDLESGKVEPIPVKAKDMLDLTPVDCDRLSSEEITAELQNLCKDVDIKNKIVRIKLKNVSREAYRNINHARMSRLKSEALHLEVMPDFNKDTSSWDVEQVDASSLPQEFEKFLRDEASGTPKAIQDDVIAYGTYLIGRIAAAPGHGGLR